MKTIDSAELSNSRMVAGNERRIRKVIVDGTVREWVGIGWIDCGKPTRDQTRRLRHVTC